MANEEKELVAELIAWLKKRGEPDSGIRYEANRFERGPYVELHGSDATFIVDHFHGAGARSLASTIERLSAIEQERDALREALRDLLRAEYESAGFGLCDCIDNDGKPYQSDFLDKALKRAEAVLNQTHTDASEGSE